jgi:hypothetical protein
MPPAASTTRASGAHSYTSLSLAGAEALQGLQNSPPPCGVESGWCQCWALGRRGCMGCSAGTAWSM